MGWAFQDKHALHDDSVPVFLIVTPTGNVLSVADPGAVSAVLTKRKDFTKLAAMYGTQAILSCHGTSRCNTDDATEQLNVLRTQYEHNEK